LARAIVAVIVALAVERAQLLIVLRQSGEHRFAALNVGRAVVRRDRIDAQRVKRMAFWGDQIPAIRTLFSVEKAFGVERRAVEPTAEFIQPWAIRQPGLGLLLLLGGSGLELLVAADFLRPLATGKLTVAID